MPDPKPSRPPKGTTFDRTRVSIVAVAALFMALYWVNLFHGMATNEDDAFADAQRRAVFTAQSAAEAVETTLDRFRVSLRIAGMAAIQGPQALAMYGQAVSSGADDMVNQLFFVDAAGDMTYSSLGAVPRTFLGDREYFKALSGSEASFVVSGPLLGRISKQWSLQLAHAVRDKGQFIGVVAITVSPERWTERLAKFESGPRDVLTLLAPDGSYQLRTLDLQPSYGQRVPSTRPFLNPASGESGTYVETGARDGVLRLYAWRRLSSGQVLAAGVALQDALAPIRELNRQTMTRGAAASVALLLAVGLIIHLVGRAQRASHSVAEKEYLQRVTLSAMAEGLAVVSPAGEVLFHNESFARILPYTGDRLRRMGATEPWDMVDQDSRPLDLQHYPEVLTARTGEPAGDVIVGVRSPDRKTRWLNVNTRPLVDKRGAVTAAILTMSDITAEREAERALKESEERYRTVVNSLAEGIVVQDQDGAVIACNPAAARILGTPSSPDCGWTHPLWRHIHADGTEFRPEDHPVAMTLRTGEPAEGVVMGLVKPDRSVTWIEISTAPLWGALPDHPSGAVASILDITNRKEFEDELSRSNAELEQFAYAVSHDLREPLRMVASYMQLLSRKLGTTLDEDGKEFIGFAVDGAKRMDRMLVALLEYSRVGRIGQPMEWVDSRRVLDEALLFLSPVIERLGADIRIEGEWPEIFASGDEIERLFQNLLGNALKYHQDGAVPILHVGSGLEAAEWRFSVQDNGIGIAPDQLGRLFKVFQRLHGNDRYEGSGVGLALCRKIAQRHDGRIWAESPGDGAGSTFILALPIGAVRFPGAPPLEDAPLDHHPAV